MTKKSTTRHKTAQTAPAAAGTKTPAGARAARPPPPNPNPDWQDRDIKLRSVAWAMTALIVAAFVSAFAMYALLLTYRADAERRAEAVSPLAKVREVPAGPLLQVNAAAELAELQAKQSALLTNYAWQDQMRGIVRIPIHRAMELVAEGMGLTPAPQPEPPAPPDAPTAD
jgi:hypothetical protein